MNNTDENSMSICQKCNFPEGCKYDNDACELVWSKYYTKIYKCTNWLFWNLLEDKLYLNGNRFYVLINGEYNQIQFNNFRISGDTDFNFSKRKCEQFSKLIETDKALTVDMRENFMEKLRQCNSRYHTYENFSFMPITGHLQLKKRDCGGDRFDEFLYELSQYYENGRNANDTIFRRANWMGSKGQFNESFELKNYLDLFIDGIYDYCKEVYLIKDRKFIKRIVASGEAHKKNKNNKIKMDTNDLNIYMDLAIDYWDMRKKIIVNQLFDY